MKTRLLLSLAILVPLFTASRATAQTQTNCYYVVCPTNMVVPCQGVFGARVDYQIIASNLCDPALPPVIQYSVPPGSIFPPGTNTVCALIQIPGLEPRECCWRVIVDRCCPETCLELICPEDIIVTCEQTPVGPGAILTLPRPSLTNHCGEIPNYDVSYYPSTAVPGQPAYFPVGTNAVIACVKLPDGQEICCCFQVVVRPNPQADCLPNQCQVQILCPTNLVVCVTNKQGTDVMFDLPRLINPCNYEIIGVTASIPPGSFFPIGTTTVAVCVRWRDNQGLEHETCCCFEVTVKCCPSDCENVLICPPNRKFECSPNGLVLNYNIFYTNTCGEDVKLVSVPPPGTLIFGTTTVCSWLEDTAGNVLTQCCFTVYLEDPIPPVITCPTNILAISPNCAPIKLDFPMPTATDNCRLTNITVTPPPGSTFPVGVTTVTACAYDAAGNFDCCTFTVTVRCQPTNCVEILCPTNIFVLCANTNGARVNYQAIARDTCNGATVPTTCVPPPGSLFPLGCTTVVCYATNAAGAIVAECSFKVCVLPKGCYVRNPSFERLLPGLPVSMFCGDPIWFAAAWTNTVGTPDLFRPTNGVPLNCRGVEKPCHGENYAGLEAIHSPNGLLTEEMMGALSTPLSNGKRFRLRACLSLAESSPGPVLVEFYIANFANPSQRFLIAKQWVTKTSGWQGVKSHPLCFPVPKQGLWNAIIVRAAAPAPGAGHGYVYVDRVDICCCYPILSRPVLVGRNVLRLDWEGPGQLRYTTNLFDPESWMPVEGEPAHDEETDMYSQEFMVDSFFDIFFEVQALEPDNFDCPDCP